MTAPESSLAQQLETIERMVRNEARQALSLARDLLADAPLDDDLVYERLRLAKGAAQARLGETADGARLMREVKVWAEDNDETELLAMCHRQLSMLFRRVGDPALMLEHASPPWSCSWTTATRRCEPSTSSGSPMPWGRARSTTPPSAATRRPVRWQSGATTPTCVTLSSTTSPSLSSRRVLSEEAVTTSERLLEEVAESGQPILTHIGDTVARSYMAVGRYADASAVLAPLCEIPESDEDCDGLALALLTLAEAKRLGADLDSAREALDRASNLIEEFSLEGHRAAVLREQGELLAAAGDFESAFTTYKAFHESEMALRALERDGRARTLNAIFEATEAQRSRDYFRELATRDPLTGLHNRRHLDASLTELLDGLDGSAGHVTVGLIDLDHFKRVNDTYSHAIGDAVLQRVAGILEQAATVVEGGVAARMGGEEFVLVLPHVTESAAVPELEQLRVSLAEEPWGEVATGLAVTASIGVGSAPGDGTDKGELLAVADRNLYRAKKLVATASSAESASSPPACRRVVRDAASRSTGEVDRAHRDGVDGARISSSTAAGIAESTDSATRAWPPLVSRATCMPAMLTLASPRMLADRADHAGTVLVAEEREVLGRLDVDVVAVDLDEPLALGDADQRAGDRHLGAVGAACRGS